MTSANVTNTSVVPVSTTLQPYNDDYNEDKGFLRHIFKPGYAVQARELTQIQTLAQVQTERLGRHIFENGSIVQGGVIQYGTAITINLASTYANSDIDVADFIGKKIGYASGNNTIQYQVVAGENATDSEPPVLLVKNLTAEKFVDGTTIMTNTANTTNSYANLASSNAYANTLAITAYLPDSIFFINGFFIKVPAQTIVVSRHNTQVNTRVGIEISESIVSYQDDSSLLDPALESSNYQAPGADRFKIEATLSTRTLDSTDDTSFIELLRLKNGEPDAYTKIPIYSDIEETFARRTYDESGNYTVRPFNLQLKESSNTSNIITRLDPGKAYVFGYEFETISPYDMEIPRPLETSNYSAYDISTAYGNYFITANMQGLFDVSTMPTVDIHNVPYVFINNANTNTYNSTKIGTAKLRNILYEDSISSSNGKTHLHRAYIFDTRYTTLTGNATGGGSNTIVLNSSTISANGHAYNGMYIRLTAGAGSGDFKQIVSYNATSKTATVDSDFSATPTTATQYSIEGSFKDAESIVIATAGSSFTANACVSTDSKEGNSANGDALLSEAAYNKMIFMLPKSYIKAGLGLNNYQYRKVFTNRTFTSGSGTITAAADEALIGSGVLSDTIKLNNYLVIVKDKQTSANVANGEVLSLTASGRTVTVAGSTSTINMNLPGDTFTADVIADIMINSGSETAAKLKTLISANTTHAVLGSSNGSFVTGSSNTTVYLNSGQVWITNPNKISNQEDSLFVSDVKTLKKVYDLNGTPITSGMSLSGHTDITNRYVLDTGQYDNYYDHAAIRLKSGVQSPRGPIVVCFDYYSHGAGTSDGKGFFSLDSYPDVTSPTGYADIPTYTTEAGQTIQLRDVIDFRPSRENASNTSPNFTLNGVRIPTPNEEFTLNFDYYLPRRDLIALSKERKFLHLIGVSSELPVYPTEPSSAMILYKLDLPPYITSFANVKVNFVENKRYTMRDIGKIDERLSHIEYYTALNLLEKKASDMVIRDADGLERSKYGIVVDKFTGHQIGDVYNTDYLCAMDTSKGELRAPAEKTDYKLTKTVGSNYSQNGSIITLSYTSTEFIEQDKASKPVNLQPYAIGNYKGTVQIVPDTDYWIDTEIVPETVTNDVGTRDNWQFISGNTAGGRTSASGSSSNTAQDPFRTEWGDWQTRWFGYTEPDVSPNWSDPNNRFGFVLERGPIPPITDPPFDPGVTDPGVITTIINDHVIDISIIPYIRAREVIFKVQSMRPGVSIYSFFDDVNVDNFISRANEIVVNGLTNFNDTPYINELISSGSNTATLILNSKDVENDGNTILYVSNTVGYFAAGQTITGALSGNSTTVKAYYHYSGNAASALGNTSNIQLQAGASSTNDYYTGNTIYIVTGTGAGSHANIVSYNGATRIASVDSAFNSAPTTNTKYSIGRTKVNRRGEFAGTFYIPQGQFRVGERMMIFCDDIYKRVGFVSSSAEITYLTHGLIQQKSRDIISPTPPPVIVVPPTPNTPEPWKVPDPVPTITTPPVCGTAGLPGEGFTIGFDEAGAPVGCWHEPDPIAQTIFIDRMYKDGVFLSSIDVCFRKKDEILPVRVELRPVVNGYPSSSLVVPNSQVTLYPDQINISETPDIDNPATFTRFTFKSPIYLLGGTEYALILITDSLEYEAWVAELGQKHIGTDRIISTQPYLGSFFRSQNQRTWTAYQYEDIMFRLNRCVFSTSPATIYFKNDLPTSNKAMDWMYITVNELNIGTVTSTDYAFKAKNDSDLSLDSSFTNVIPSKNYRHNARKAILTNGESINVKVTLQTTNEYVSPIIDPSRFGVLGIKNIINNAGISNTNISLTNYGYNYTNASNIVITISGGTTGDSANAYVGAVANGNISSIIVDSMGSYYTGRANLTISGGGVIASNATARIASELDASGGPAFARYITRKVTLNDGFDAGDLRVFVTAYRPLGTELDLYAKVLSADDPVVFESQDYIKLVPATSSIRYSTNEDDYVEYEFRPSLTTNTITYTSNTGAYNTFRTFSIKLVMLSDSTITIPLVKDLRVIALPGTD